MVIWIKFLKTPGFTLYGDLQTSDLHTKVGRDVVDVNKPFRDSSLDTFAPERCLSQNVIGKDFRLV